MSLSQERRLLFVGSGLSIDMGMYSWEQLLRLVARGSAIESDVEKLLTAQDAYGAADKLTDHFGRATVERKLCDLVSKREESIRNGHALDRWIKPIRNIASSGVVTTNWDTLLLATLTGYEAIFWPAEFSKLAEYLRTNKPFVLFLHGSIVQCSLTFTRQDCQRAADYFREPSKELKQIIAIHTLVVLGFGFRDRHIENLFLAAEKFSGEKSRTIVFLKEADEPGFAKDHPDLARKAEVHKYHDYPSFYETFREEANQCDASSEILRLPQINIDIDFHELVCRQPYGFRAAERIRTAIKKNPGKYLDWSATYLLDNKWTDKRAGTFAVILSGYMNRWHPKSSVLDKLKDQTRKGLTDPSQIGVVEPVGFALAHKGFPEFQKACLEEAVRGTDWRRAHINQTQDYYEGTLQQVQAIKRHFSDHRRTGILQANDTGRLIALLESGNDQLVATIRPLLEKSMNALYRGGEDSLASYTAGAANRILSRGIPSRSVI